MIWSTVLSPLSLRVSNHPRLSPSQNHGLRRSASHVQRMFLDRHGRLAAEFNPFEGIAADEEKMDTGTTGVGGEGSGLVAEAAAAGMKTRRKRKKKGGSEASVEEPETNGRTRDTGQRAKDKAIGTSGSDTVGEGLELRVEAAGAGMTTRSKAKKMSGIGVSGEQPKLTSEGKRRSKM